MLETWPLPILFGHKHSHISQITLYAAVIRCLYADKRPTRTKQLKIVMQLEGCTLESGRLVLRASTRPNPMPPCPIPCRGPVECALDWCAEKVTCRHFSTFADAFQLADPYPGATRQLETNRWIQMMQYLIRDYTGYFYIFLLKSLHCCDGW